MSADENQAAVGKQRGDMAPLLRWGGRGKRLRGRQKIENQRILRVMAIEDPTVGAKTSGVSCEEILRIRVANNRPASRVDVDPQCKVSDDLVGSDNQYNFRIRPADK